MRISNRERLELALEIQSIHFRRALWPKREQPQIKELIRGWIRIHRQTRRDLIVEEAKCKDSVSTLDTE